MTTNWTYYLVRTALNEDPSKLPYTGEVIWDSPDIILNGTTYVAPSERTALYVNTYNKAIGDTSFHVNKQNYIYLRIKNNSANSDYNGNVEMFWSPGSIIGDPAQWHKPEFRIPYYDETTNPPTIKNQAQPIYAADPGEILCPSPFVFTPPQNGHACLIVRVWGTAPGSPNNQIPDQVWKAGDWANFVRSHGGVAWHNTTILQGAFGKASIVFGRDMDTDHTVQFTLHGENMPAGSTIYLKAGDHEKLEKVVQNPNDNIQTKVDLPAKSKDYPLEFGLKVPDGHTGETKLHLSSHAVNAPTGIQPLDVTSPFQHQFGGYSIRLLN